MYLTETRARSSNARLADLCPSSPKAEHCESWTRLPHDDMHGLKSSVLVVWSTWREALCTRTLIDVELNVYVVFL